MSRTWIYVLIAAGVVAAIAIGLIGNHGRDSSRRAARAESSFCSDLSAYRSSIASLIALNPTSASKSDYEDAVNEIESDWDALQSSTADVASATRSELEDAWNTFQSSVQDVPSDASAGEALSDIRSAADTLRASARSALSGPDCSS
jgi:hypothetical protein